MIKVYTSSVIDASADAVWAHIRDFNGLPKWHPAIADSRIEGLDARVEASLVGRGVTIARSEAKPRAYRFMVGDSSEIGVL